MNRLAARALPLVLAALVLGATAGPAAAADLTQLEAERYVVTLINQQRAAIGLKPLFVDARVESLARYRSADMAKYHYFSHENHDGRYAWDIMTDTGITWYWAGEIIAWNTWPTLKESAEVASQGWHDSPPHYAIISDADYNYIGAGYAYDSSLGRKIWTAVFLKGPDRTGAWSRMNAPTLRTTLSTTSTSKYYSISWLGNDYQLSVLTAGFKVFQLQKRVDGGTWQWLTKGTTATHSGGYFARGHTYEYRVRGVDKAGNYGRWSASIAIRP